jgi:hypothetical protein
MDKNKRLGKYLVQRNSEELYKAYLPSPLPPDPELDLQRLYPYLEKIGILEEITHKKRDKIYVYRKYLDFLEEKTEPFK